MEIENKKLERYAELNPDLIYVYLEHLNRKFNLRLSDPDSNFHNYFGYLLNTSKEKKVSGHTKFSCKLINVRLFLWPKQS